MQTQVHGGDIYSNTYRLDFSTNINPFGMPDSVRQAAMEGVEQSIHYPDVQCRILRSAISRKEQIREDWIICGNGAAELLFSLAAVKKPKKALLAVPGFAEYEQALKTTPCEIVYYELSKEHGFHLEEGYLEALKDDVDFAVLCNPNNPTGISISTELLERIIRICREKHIFLVLDECFLEFVQENIQNPQKEKLPEMSNLFILKAFTKMYGMPGLRLGYGLCSDTALLSKMKEFTQPWNVSMPAQLAGAAACRERDFAEKTRNYIHIERIKLMEKLKMLGFRVYDSQANYIFFEAPEDLYEVCAKEGILIRDCSNYHGLKAGYFRIAVKRREENQQLLEIFTKHYR